MSSIIDLKDQKFGRLLVVSRATKNATDGKAQWNCRCDCGGSAVVVGRFLRTGHTQSCGCLLSQTLVARNKTHGLRYHPLYARWKGMKQRCLNPKSRKYKSYGARGITIYEQWIKSFPAFLKYIEENLSYPPPPRYSIDRINNNGNYEPGNIRWADYQMQMSNRREQWEIAPHYTISHGKRVFRRGSVWRKKS